jgi:hypothetical protein
MKIVLTLFVLPLNLAAVVPGQLLNLTNWYLTLPIGEPEDPLDIYQKNGLNTYTVSPWFKVDATGKYVNFRANCGGVTTSGSSHPRSELREMKNNGADKASWSTSTGCHIMEITQKVTHLPAKNAIVVCGQIHDADDDVTVFRLEKNKLWATKGDVSHGQLLSDAIQLNVPFTVAFVAHNGKIEMYLNGEKKFTYTKSTSGCYFKAGSYVQSNVAKGDSANDYAEVAISRLHVFHKSSGDTTYVPGKFFVDGSTSILSQEKFHVYQQPSASINDFDPTLKMFTLNGAVVKNSKFQNKINRIYVIENNNKNMLYVK